MLDPVVKPRKAELQKSPNNKFLMNNDRGFTLLEIMVALSVFAILSTITATALYNAFDTRTRVNAQANQLNATELGLTYIARDITQVVNRGIHGQDINFFPAFIGESHRLEFTRGGVVNPDGVELRSTLKRVAYRCAGPKLIRRSWASVDDLKRDKYQDKTLFDQLEECKFAYLTRQNQVSSEWHEYTDPQTKQKERFPVAVQLTLTPNRWGNMSLLFSLPIALYAPVDIEDEQ